MKTTTSLLCRLAAVAALVFPAATLPSFAQTTATTDPVGFVTIAVAGNGGSGQPAYTFTSIGMTNAIAYQATTTSVGGATSIVDGSSTWADNAYNGAAGVITHYVEIVSGLGAGTTYDITGTTAATHTLTLLQPLLGTIVSGASYKVRPHWTLATVFGTGTAVTLGKGTSTTADQVQLLRGSSLETYFYQPSGFGGEGWRKIGAAATDAGGTVIYPDDGIIIARLQSAATSIVVQGAVKTGQTSIPVLAGYTLLGNVYASGMTLTSSGLYTGDPNTGVAVGTSTTADQIQFWNPGTLGLDTYFYQPSGFGGAGWRKIGAAATDAGITPIPVGTAILINRIGGAAFNWIAPQHPTSFN